MTSSDPIADLLTRIRNAGMARLERIDVPASNMKLRIAELLRESGYLQDVTSSDAGPQGTLHITLRFDEENRSLIHEIKRISKPGRRKYVAHTEIPTVKNGLGVCLLSTSKGVMTGAQARALGVGGELLCEVW